PQQKQKRGELLRDMEKFLSGNDNAFKSWINFFEYDKIGKAEYGHVIINEVPDTSKVDKEVLTQSAADTQILIAMGVHPTLFGAGALGSGQQRSGGSDIRESKLVYDASLNLERNVVLEPLYLMRDFNGWDSDIVFRVRDTVLTTLDTGAGTKKVLS
ncbi:MAG: hypothetical protein ABI166_08875, partial [Mucilaginibacter sp.]